jgi:GT2 family glycosyltransferase
MGATRISIVIPVFNGGSDLHKCLDAIAASSYPVFECILVDDASTDGMTEQVAELHGARVIHLYEQLGPARARNRGVEEAAGDLIFFVDADVLVQPDTLEIAVKVLESEPETAAVFGSYDDEPGHRSFLSQYRNLFHHWVHQTGHNEASTFWTGCGVIRRETFMEMGGFKTTYQRPSIEDIELGSRLCRSGHRIRLEKTMLCKHMKQWRFWNLINTDIFRRGIPWVVLLLQNRKAPSDLNLSHDSRLATLLAGILALSLMALLLTGHVAAIFPAVAFLLADAVCILFTGKRNTGTLLTLTLTVSAPLVAYWLAPDLLALIPLTLILLLVWTHIAFYRYAAQKRNVAFAFAVIPMQVIFFLGCAVSGVLGLIIYFFAADREPSAH